jgi:hypothetical protein
MKHKLSSMIPGDDWYASYNGSEGVFKLRIVCWALEHTQDDCSNICGFVVNGGGVVPANSIPGFIAYSEPFDNV